MANAEIVILEDAKTLAIIRELPTDMLQGRLLIDFLAKHPNSPTEAVIFNCNIVNVSDVARKVNAYLFPRRLMVSCEKPPRMLYGPKSDFLWSIYQVPDAVNDAVYDTSPEYNQDVS